MLGKNMTFLDFNNNFYDEAKLAKARRPAFLVRPPYQTAMDPMAMLKFEE